jgi:hypothetical protein
MIMTMLERKRVFVGPRGHLLSNLTQLTLIGLSLGLFLPPAIAYFPQRAETTGKRLGGKFADFEGPIYFNKGL